MKDKTQQFNKNGYCIIKNAISKELTDFVTQYAIFDENQNFNPDTVQVKGAHAKYADPCMETMLLHLHKLIQENTGLTLYPTYSFYRVYRNNDKLDKHTDRPSCEISATMCFNYGYKDYNWPIFMGDTKVILNPSDLVIYKGCELDHWREPLVYNEPTWHVQGFFHYVDVNGPYANYKYDGRESIGVAKLQQKIEKSNKTYIQYL